MNQQPEQNHKPETELTAGELQDHSDAGSRAPGSRVRDQWEEAVMVRPLHQQACSGQTRPHCTPAGRRQLSSEGCLLACLGSPIS